MEDEVNIAQSKKLEELEKGKLETVTVYTIEAGSFNKWSTTDKDAAFKIWQTLSDNFFTLESLGSDYTPPHFSYRKPVQIKLTGEKKQVWLTYEDAQRALNAFEALSNKPKKQ